jgi:hypothetical protein
MVLAVRPKPIEKGMIKGLRRNDLAMLTAAGITEIDKKI